MLLIKEGTDHIIEDETQIPYRLRKILGQGHSSTVAEVEDQLTGRIFAQKTIRVRCMKYKWEKEQTFDNEVSIIRRLQVHHHMIQVFSTYMTDRTFNLILDPVADSGDLHDFLITYRDALDGDQGIHNLDIRSMTSTLEQAFGCLTSGITFMHDHNIRHKDIKPQNILIHQGRVIFTDFGYSLDFSELKDSKSIGPPGVLTRKYAAPEVLACPPQPRNRSSDIYSLGCVFIEILSALGVISIDGHHPYSEVMTQLHEQLSSTIVTANRSFLPGTVIMMTLRNPAFRWKASQILNEARQHPGFSCGECQPDQTKDQPQSISRFIEQSCQTEPVLLTGLKERDMQSLSNDSASDVFAKPTTANASSTDLLSTDGVTPCLQVPPSPANFRSTPIPFGGPFDRIDEIQKELQDVREKMMSLGFRLSSKRRELHARRQECAQEGGAAFSLLRRFLQDSNVEVPANLVHYLSKYEEQRDALDQHEAEHEEAEEQYNAVEWNYSKQETKIVDELETPASKSLTDLPELASDLWECCNTPRLFGQLLSRAQPERQLQWSEKSRRIDDWLFDALQNSKLDKLRLRNSMPNEHKPDYFWWETVVKNWDSSVSHHNFHTGNSISSGTSPTPPFHVADTFRTAGITDCAFDSTENPLWDIEFTDLPPLDSPRDLDSNDLSMDVSDSVEPSKHADFQAGKTRISRLSCSFSSQTFGSYSTAPTIDFLTSGSEGGGTDNTSERGGRPIRTMTSPMSSPLTRSWPVELFDISTAEAKPPLQRISKLRQEVSSLPQSRQPSPTRAEAPGEMKHARLPFPVLRLTPSMESLHRVTHQDDIPFVFAPNAPFKLPGPCAGPVYDCFH